MGCEEFADGNLIDAWLEGYYLEAVVCPYDLQMGALTFGLFIYGGAMLGLYQRTQSLVVPFVITILAGTVAISRIPSQAHQLVGMGVLLGVTIGIMYVYLRMQNVT